MRQVKSNHMHECSERKNRWTAAFAGFVLVSAMTGFLFDAHTEQSLQDKSANKLPTLSYNATNKG